MHDLCNFFCTKIIFDQNYFLTAEIILTTRGHCILVLLYLEVFEFSLIFQNYDLAVFQHVVMIFLSCACGLHLVE